MKNLLGKGQLATLHEFARRRVLVAFDFDGTLAPIVRDPEAAAMRKVTAARLTKVATLYPCAVISGRGRADVSQKVSGIPLRAVFGNHGMEPWRGLPAARRLVARWRGELAGSLPQAPGVIVEDKGPSLAIHYRRARARATIRRLVLHAAGRLRDTRIVEGKMVVNVLPANAPDKGAALLQLCKRLRCDAAIYVGDDDTDEDAFAVAGRFPLLGIRVGHARRSRASYFLPGQTDIDRLLARLVQAREAELQTLNALPSRWRRAGSRTGRAASSKARSG
jgi:trehalose 6-phosphate phosphatase